MANSDPNEPSGHCYMFREEPTEVCMQHTGRKGTLWRTVDVLISPGYIDGLK